VEKIAEIRRDPNRVPEPGRITVAQYLDRWLLDSAAPSVRPTTLANYQSVIRCHVTPRIGAERLARIDPLVVQRLYGELEAGGTSARLRQLVHAVLHRAFWQAVRWNLMRENPCDRVTRPRVPRKEVRALSPKEVHRLLEAARGDRFEALYVLAVTTGLRQGELFGLRWNDIDLRRRALGVQRAIVDVNGHVEIVQPKSAKGRRRVELPDLAVQAIRDHRARLRVAPHPEAWVFSDGRGGSVRKNNFTRRSWYPLRDRAGFGEVRFHDLRHTAASLLLSAGVRPKIVQERLGHSTVALTLDVYSHVLGSLQRDAAEQLDEILK
jgi:integrase